MKFPRFVLRLSIVKLINAAAPAHGCRYPDSDSPRRL